MKKYYIYGEIVFLQININNFCSDTSFRNIISTATNTHSASVFSLKANTNQLACQYLFSFFYYQDVDEVYVFIGKT